MNIFLAGGTGRTGKHIVTQAVQRGHTVHALVRFPEKLPLTSPRLHVFTGAPDAPESVHAAMKGCEAVICALNVSRRTDFPWDKLVSSPTLISDSVKVMIDGMKAENIRRIVTISAWGAGESMPDIPWWFRFLIRNSKIGFAYRDHERQEALLQKSGLDWTAIRPVGLTNSTRTKQRMVSLNNQPRPGLTISRAETAAFVLDCVEQGLYIGQTPAVSSK